MLFTACVECGGQLKTVKKQFDFKIEDIPFRTKQKYERMQCLSCNEEYIPGDVAKQMDKEFATARTFLAEQDAQYRVNNNNPIIPIKGYVSTLACDYAPPTPAKQWHRGFIHYLRYLQTGDSVKIVPSSAPYTIYCNSEDKLSTAARQFVKPDDYFKLTSIV